MFKDQQDLYKLIIDTTDEGIWVIDENHITTFVNDRMATMLGYSSEEMLGRSLASFMDEEGREIVAKNMRRRETEIPHEKVHKMRHKNGDVVWVFVNSNQIFKDGKDAGVLGMITDITEKHIEEELQRESYKKYISLFEDSPVPIWYEDFSQIKIELDKLKAKGVTSVRNYFEGNDAEVLRVSGQLRVIDINKAVVELNEADSREHILGNFRGLITRRSSEYAMRQFEAIWDGLPTCQFDAELKTFKGNIRYVNLKWTVVKGHEEDYGRVHLTTTDLTERIVDENIALQSSNREKAVLLKEIHHRVKNNLQIITSLLNLQSRSLEDEKTKSLFEMSLNRIQSMAKVHELLYQSNNFSKIDYKDYLETLIEPLITSIKGVDNEISLDLEVSGIELNINTAIPMGLIINEILMNSLKHGIDVKGSIYLRIQKREENMFVLEIGDDGKGFDVNHDIKNSDSLGLQLISSLTEQVNGELTRLFDMKGTHYRISFEELPQNR